MAVKRIVKGGDKITLEISGIEACKYDQALAEWGFKSDQAFIRFFVSVCLLSQDKRTIGFIDEGRLVQYAPTQDLLK